jgi:3-oxoacyl-[acyl-carrier protein] reductase
MLGDLSGDAKEQMMELELKGKKAVVCAASKGLGLAVAKSLYAEGVELLICARNSADLECSAKEIAKFAGRNDLPQFIAVDLSKPEASDAMLSAIKTKLGHVDILVNNVGGPAPSSAEATSLDAWRSGFDQIFLSASLLTQKVIPLMKQKSFGRIITITSLSVVEPIDHLVVSTAMRTAVTAFMKTLSKEVAGLGITVNTVQPGVIHTDRIVNLRKARAEREGTSLAAEMEKTSKSIPMGRLGEPHELADLVTFLASARSSYITGANIPVDGGAKASWV